MNANKLRGKIIENGMSVPKLSSTFYRKLKEGNYNIREAVAISRELKLSSDEVMAIFFDNSVA